MNVYYYSNAKRSGEASFAYTLGSATIVMYTQIHPVTSLLKSTMKQTYYIQSPLRISKALPSEPKVSNTGGNCPCSEAKLPNRIFTNLLRNLEPSVLNAKRLMQ